MRLFNVLTLAFCVAVQALPAASPEALPVALSEANTLSGRAPNAAFLDTRVPKGKKKSSLVKEIEGELDSLSLSLTSTIDELVAKLGLSAVDDDITTLLSGLVGDVDGLVAEVDGIVDPLLISLGLGEELTTIDDLEKALGLSPKNTIRKLLKSLGIL